MFQKIINLDHQLFNFINQRMQCAFLDTWMPIITDFDNWMWLMIVGLIGLFMFGGYRGRVACIVIVVTVLIADNFTSYILKPFFGRIRPNVIVEAANATGHVPSPAFPSGHATNIFALAMVLSWYYRKIAPICFLVAITVGFSRIYIGVHYPFDVIGGAFVGIAWALIIIWFTKQIELFINSKRKKGACPHTNL